MPWSRACSWSWTETLLAGAALPAAFLCRPPGACRPASPAASVLWLECLQAGSACWPGGCGVASIPARPAPAPPTAPGVERAREPVPGGGAHMGARPVVGALTLGLDVPRWQQGVGQHTGNGVCTCRSPCHTDTAAQAPASWLRLWFWTRWKHGESKSGRLPAHMSACVDAAVRARLRADGAPYVRPPVRQLLQMTSHSSSRSSGCGAAAGLLWAPGAWLKVLVSRWRR